MKRKKIPPGQSPVRYITSQTHPDAGGHAYTPLKSFGEAKSDPDGVVVLEGDWGGQIYMTARMSVVKCSEKELLDLLDDLDIIAWECNKGDGKGLYYERIPVGGGVAGGMGGGTVTHHIWLHPSIASDSRPDLQARIELAVLDIIDGRLQRLPEELRSHRRD